jgi:heme a synthase
MNLVNDGATRSEWLHRFAVATSATTFFLIFVGGLVKSHEAGLSVPDWPNTYGEFMLTFPYSKWVGNIFYEHSHRLVATLVGFLLTVQAIWLQRSEKRKWVKRLGWFALVGVIVQGILGGLTVIYLLPTAISSSHAGLAQTVFCLTLSIALVTSRHWHDDTIRLRERSETSLRTLTVLTVGMIFLQLMMGAVMRHEEAGLAIPTFPLAPNGSLLPDFTSFGVAINFAHRIGAIFVAVFVFMTVRLVIKHYSEMRSLVKPAKLAVVILLAQIALGIIAVLTEKAVTPTTLHVSGGAALLGTMLVIAIRARHLLIPKNTPDVAPQRIVRECLTEDAVVLAEA